MEFIGFWDDLEYQLLKYEYLLKFYAVQDLFFLNVLLDPNVLDTTEEQYEIIHKEPGWLFPCYTNENYETSNEDGKLKTAHDEFVSQYETLIARVYPEEPLEIKNLRGSGLVASQIDDLIYEEKRKRSILLKELRMQVYRHIIINHTSKHIGALSLRFRQTIAHDAYGLEICDKWEQEIAYFLRNVVCLLNDPKRILYAESLVDYPELFLFIWNSIGKAQRWSMESRYAESKKVHDDSMNIINDMVRKYMQTDDVNHRDPKDVSELNPQEFEIYCADLLNEHGWITRLTPKSFDKGIDIIATHESVKVVIQCKKYSGPVGISAVQEIVAGKEYEQADFAAVVATSKYTKAAMNLASVTEVYLLHYSELGNLSRCLGFNNDYIFSNTSTVS